jgi:hypothetical protein
LRRTAAGLLAALAGLLAAESAAAEPAKVPSRVLYRQGDCVLPEIDPAILVLLLRIELFADGVKEVGLVLPSEPATPLPIDPGLAVVSLEGACQAGGALTLAIDDAATARSVRRAIYLGDLPPKARARALALATAELLRASWAELALPGLPPPLGSAPKATRKAVAARAPESLPDAWITPPPPSPATPAGARVFGAGLEGRFFSGGLDMQGGRLSASIPLPSQRLLRLRFDGGAAYGSAFAPRGKIDLWLISGAIGLSFGVGSPAFQFELGPRLELGWGHAEGRPTVAGVIGHQGGDVVAVASLVGAGRVFVGAGFWTTLELEVGPVLKGFAATVDQQAAATFGGAMGAARFGLAFSL